MIRSILLGIVMFMLLVILHEIGHFIACKLTGVKVTEFGIGIPPKLFTLFKDKSGTEYTLNALPFGGFVAPKGENPHDPDSFKDKDTFMKATLFSKIIILIAGVVMNIILARILFSFAFRQGVKPIAIMPDNLGYENIYSQLIPKGDYLLQNNLVDNESLENAKVLVTETLPGGLAEKAGIRSGDTIIKINDTEVNILTFRRIIKQQKGKEFMVELLRSNNQGERKIFTYQITCPQSECFIGIDLESTAKINYQPIKLGLIKSLSAGWNEVYAQTNLTLYALGRLGGGLVSFNKQKFTTSINSMRGPVGAIKIGKDIMQEGGRSAYIAFSGMISLALAIFNILPIPALDGGRLLGVLIQYGFRIPKEKYFRVENIINMVFFFLLMALGVYILIKDLVVDRGVGL